MPLEIVDIGIHQHYDSEDTSKSLLMSISLHPLQNSKVAELMMEASTSASKLRERLLKVKKEHEVVERPAFLILFTVFHRCVNCC